MIDFDTVHSEIEWTSETETQRAVEILRLLGYNDSWFHIDLHGISMTVSGEWIRLTAWQCMVLLPSNLKHLIDDTLVTQARQQRINKHNADIWHMLENR